MIRTTCPGCEKKYQVPEKYLGRKFACKQCGKAFLLQPEDEARSPSEKTVRKSPVQKSQRQPSTQKKRVPEKKQAAPKKKVTDNGQLNSGARLPRIKESRMMSPEKQYEAKLKQLIRSIRELEKEDEFYRPRVSILHRLNALIVACMMLILPLLYLGFIAGVAWLTWWHTTHNYVWMTYVRGRVTIFLAALYGFLVIAGFLWVLSLIRPIFSRVSFENPEEGLEREDQPVLFELADVIADVVGSPHPDKIILSFDVNASASYETMFFGLFRKNFTLTLGIPLIAGLNVDELAGVIAHEFGHFSQKGSMFLHRMIYKINLWFAMAVYGTSMVDHMIHSTTDDEEASIFSIMGFLLWILVGLGRIVLWCLMMLGLFFSSSLLRRTEYDADRYEIGLVGSDLFKSTSKKIISLNIAFSLAEQYTLGSNQGLRLPDDFAIFTAGISERSEIIRKKMIKHIRTEKHSFYSSHPTTLSRIEVAQKLDMEPLYKCNLPAKLLVVGFTDITQSITMEIYRWRFGKTYNLNSMRDAEESIGSYIAAMK